MNTENDFSLDDQGQDPPSDTEENINTSMVYNDPSASFVAEFYDGYSFRNLIGYLRGTNCKGSFSFSNNLIRYVQDDPSHTLLNQIEIQTYELTHYEFNSKSEEILMGVNIADVWCIAKTIRKKDVVRLYKKWDDLNLYIQIISNNNRSCGWDNVSIIRPINDLVLTVYEMPGYGWDEKQPNFTVPSTDFSRICTALASIKCDFIEIHGFPQGATFKSMTKGDIVGRVETLGNCDLTAPRSPIYQVKSSMVKALAKLNNLSNMGTIKFYLEPNHPMKLLSQIGTYGTLCIYIRSSSK